MKKWVFIFYRMHNLCRRLYITVISKEIDVKIGGENSAVKNENMKKVEVTKEEIYKGDLLLVNKDYPVKKIVLGLTL